MVRLIFDKYTVEDLSIGAIARLLRETAPPTRKRVTRWERSVVWGILRNPAYKGTACFNKTKVGPRQKVTKPFRCRVGRFMAKKPGRTSGRGRDGSRYRSPPLSAKRPSRWRRNAWSTSSASRRAAPLSPASCRAWSCRKCGYALHRTSTRSSARKIHYYRCLGSDGWRHLGGSVCDSRPIRQDLLNHIVWQEVIWLIEDPGLITAELDRRLDAARASRRRNGRTLRGQTR